MIFKKYYSTRKGKYSDESRKLAEELTKTQREPTENELKLVKFNYRKAVDYQNAINELLGTDLYLLQLDFKKLDILYEAIKKLK